MKILAIEDNLILGRSYQELFRIAGYTVSLANTLESAKALYQQEHFPIILSDVMFNPSWTIEQNLTYAHEFWQYFKNNGSTVIVISGLGNIKQSVEQHGVYFVLKPMRSEDVLNIIRNQ
jgi:DNA-binding NtrC family response regulator